MMTDAEKIRILSDALNKIIRHQEDIGGGLAMLSATRRIALSALAEVRDDGAVRERTWKAE